MLAFDQSHRTTRHWQRECKWHAATTDVYYAQSVCHKYSLSTSQQIQGSWVHWHMMDFIISRQSDLRDVRLTRAVCSTSAWSDHWLIKCSIFLSVWPVKCRRKALRMCRIVVLFRIAAKGCIGTRNVQYTSNRIGLYSANNSKIIYVM